MTLEPTRLASRPEAGVAALIVTLQRDASHVDVLAAVCSAQLPVRGTTTARPVGVVWGWRRGDDARHPCFLTEREALSYMADRLRRIAVFER